MLGIECIQTRQTVESIVVYQTPNVQKYISKTAVQRLMTLKNYYFYFILIDARMTSEFVWIEMCSRKL